MAAPLDYDSTRQRQCYCYRPLLRLSWRLDNLPRIIAAVALAAVVGDFVRFRWRCTRCGRVKLASSYAAWEMNRETRLRLSVEEKQTVEAAASGESDEATDDVT